ncbi:MAG TPA: metallophosphoesterase [Fimbriimonas sp.]|nr:metallophosphoesterase [Fimbriimonas sp.]
MIATLLCSLALQSGFHSLNSKPLPPESNDFWFVALGDNRPAGAGLPPTETFRNILAEVSAIDPAFIVSSGDLLYGNEETLAQYNQEIAWMKPVIDELPCPFFNVPGNHEINNRQEFFSAYTRAFGAPYGSFTYGGWQFVGICTEIPAPKPSVFGDQLQWLKQTLSAKTPTVTFEHHPVFARDTNTEKETATIQNAHEIHELFRTGNVKMALEGHDHIYNQQTHDGVDYRLAGGAGAPLDGSPTDGGFFHFLLVHVHGASLEAVPVPAGTLEVTPLQDGTVAASDYAFADLPLNNLTVRSSFKPSSVSAGYTTKKGKLTAVEARIVGTVEAKDGFETRIALVLPQHHATVVKLAK